MRVGRVVAERDLDLRRVGASATTSAPLVPVTMSVLLAMDAEPAFCAAAAGAVSAGRRTRGRRPTPPRPRAPAAARPRLSLRMGGTSFCDLVPTDCRLAESYVPNAERDFEELSTVRTRGAHPNLRWLHVPPSLTGQLQLGRRRSVQHARSHRPTQHESSDPCSSPHAYRVTRSQHTSSHGDEQASPASRRDAPPRARTDGADRVTAPERSIGRVQRGRKVERFAARALRVFTVGPRLGPALSPRGDVLRRLRMPDRAKGPGSSVRQWWRLLLWASQSRCGRSARVGADPVGLRSPVVHHVGRCRH